MDGIIQGRKPWHIVKDVMVIFGEAFSIHPSVRPSCHPSMDGIIQGRKPF
jgi:hypothetical protein